MQENRTITIIQDTRYDRGDGKYPLKLRITFKLPRDGKSKWEQKYITSDHYLTVDEFEAMPTTKDSILRSVRKDMEDLKAKAEAIKGYMTPDAFMAAFTGSGNLKNVLDFCDVYARVCAAQDRIKTAEMYRNAKSSFTEFITREDKEKKTSKPGVKKPEIKNPYLSFVEVTVAWLKSYERWMLENGRSINTIGIYLRALRSIFNLAIDDAVISQDLYPFGRRRKFKIAKKKKTKWAPTGAQKDAILAFKTDDEKVRWGLDMAIFSYLGSGMNPADIAHLRFNMIDGEAFKFERVKTRNTERDKVDMNIPIHERVRKIMLRWGNKTLDPNAYIFPVLQEGMSAKQKSSAIHDFTADVNKILKPIGKELKIPKVLTFGIFRHMYATTMLRAGVAIEFISAQLGHSSIQVTINYCHSFEDDTILKASGHL